MHLEPELLLCYFQQKSKHTGSLPHPLSQKHDFTEHLESTSAEREGGNRDWRGETEKDIYLWNEHFPLSSPLSKIAFFLFASSSLSLSPSPLPFRAHAGTLIVLCHAPQFMTSTELIGCIHLPLLYKTTGKVHNNVLPVLFFSFFIFNENNTGGSLN